MVGRIVAGSFLVACTLMLGGCTSGSAELKQEANEVKKDPEMSKQMQSMPASAKAEMEKHGMKVPGGSGPPPSAGGSAPPK